MSRQQRYIESRVRSEYYEPQIIHETQASDCAKFLYMIWKIFTCVFSHFLMICLVVSYCILGAFTFEKLEADYEKEVKKGISRIRIDTIQNIWDYTKTELTLNESQWIHDIEIKLKDFEKNIITEMKRKGWDGDENIDNIQWTFTGALFYSIIVITTIGYGHIAPKTPYGKIVTIFYAILGIPLMLLCLSNIGDVLASSFRFIYWRVCCYICTRPPKRRIARRSTHRNRILRSRSQSTIRRRPRQLGMMEPSEAFSDTNLQRMRSQSVRERMRNIGASDDLYSRPGRPRRYLSQQPVPRHDDYYEMRRARSIQLETLGNDHPLATTSIKYNTINNHLDNGYNQDEYYDFPKITLPLEDIEAALYDLEQHQNKLNQQRRPGQMRSQSLPRQKRNKFIDERRIHSNKENRRSLDYDRKDGIEKIYKADETVGLKKISKYDNYPQNYGNDYRTVGERPRWFLEYDSGESEIDDIEPSPLYSRKFGRSSSEYRPEERRFKYEDVDRNRRARSLFYERDNRYRGDYRRPYDSHQRGNDPFALSTRRSQNYMKHPGEERLDLIVNDGRRRKPIKGAESAVQSISKDYYSKVQVKPVPIWLCALLVISYILAGAFLFHNWENWKFLDSAYFCFITLTTIGFGDFVPAQRIKSNSEISTALCSLYLLFGISLLAMSLNLVQEQVIGKVKSVAKKLGILKSEETTDDEDYTDIEKF